MKNKIFLGDVLRKMKKIKSESVDMIFVDPPFNLNKKYKNNNDNNTPEDYLMWCYTWIDECIRVLKPTGTLFLHNIPKWLIYLASHLNDRNLVFRHWISWNAFGRPAGSTLLPAHYGILYYTKSDMFTFNTIRHPHFRCRKCKELVKDYGGKKYLMHPYGPILSDVWNDIHRIRHSKQRDNHPNQLPELLLERLILMSTNEHDLVLDPLMGTGTTVIVAKRLNRHYIGIDNVPEYVDIVEQKLEQVETSIYFNRQYIFDCIGQTTNSYLQSTQKFKNITDKQISVNKKNLENTITSRYVKYDFKII